MYIPTFLRALYNSSQLIHLDNLINGSSTLSELVNGLLMNKDKQKIYTFLQYLSFLGFDFR